MKKEKNAYVCIKEYNQNGKKYENIYVSVELNNGMLVTFQVKQAFYNRKFASLLALNLPKESVGTKDGKKSK